MEDAFYESCRATVTFTGIANTTLFSCNKFQDFGYWPNEAAANLPLVFLSTNIEAELSPTNLDCCKRLINTSIMGY